MRGQLSQFSLLAALLLGLVMPVAASENTDPELRRLLKAAIESDHEFVDRFDAQVWLLDMSRRLEHFVPETERRIKILQQVHYEARRSGLEPELVLALIEVESHFDEYAISVAGARGLMQVMPFWLDEIGNPGENLFNIPTNLRMGCTILRYYMDMEPDSLTRALARYNGSLGRNVYPNKVFTALNRRWFKQ